MIGQLLAAIGMICFMLAASLSMITGNYLECIACVAMYFMIDNEVSS